LDKPSTIPKYDDLFKPTLESLAKLGGSASIEELEDALAENLALTQDQLDLSYPTSGAAIVPDRMSWARSFLKVGGFVTNPKRGVWVLTEEGRDALSKSNADLKGLSPLLTRSLWRQKRLPERLWMMSQEMRTKAMPQAGLTNFCRSSRASTHQPSSVCVSVCFERVASRVLRSAASRGTEASMVSASCGST